MDIKFIETVYVKFADGKNVISPISVKSYNPDEMNKEGIYYKYYDGILKGFILIPMKNYIFHKLFGYYYQDIELVKHLEDLEKKKQEEKEKKEREKKEKEAKKKEKKKKRVRETPFFK